jgi:hypothetical protein
MTENKKLMEKLAGTKTKDRSGKIIEWKESEETDYYTQEAKNDKMRAAFSDAAVAAAKKWTFEPVKVDGKVSSIVYPLEFKFTLDFKDVEQPKTKDAPPKDETQQE